jgi:two-component system, OmpR family, phosphate regulon sensor histidine kinase PhoR
MTKFRTRLLFTLLALFTIVLVGLGLLLGELFQNYYLNTFDDRLKKESNLVALYLEDNGGITSFQQDTLTNFSEKLGARLSIIDLEGRVLYDSGEIEKTSNKEFKDIIKQIVQNDEANKDEFKGIDQSNLHYYWEPIVHNGKNEGFILLSTKMTELKQAYQQIWWILTISFGLALVIILFLGSKITNRYTKPIERATNVAFELAKGNYRARTYEDQLEETGMLNSSINILARNLQNMMKAHEVQKDRLGTLIENMGSGLILIDSRGYINLINRTYKELFGVRNSEYLFKLYYEVIENKEVCKIVEDIFMIEQKVKKQLVIPINIERRHFEVYGVPIIGTNDVWKGILLVFHDITEIKKLEQTRKDFVANVSHELRTPITSIKGFSETLLDGAMENKETLEAFLNIILKETDRLQSLINDLLELSKIENEGFSLSIQSFNLVDTVNEVVEMLHGKSVEKEINLWFEEYPEEVFIEGDIYRLKQVFINIISNALLYTPNGGAVSITIEESPEKVLVHIKDTGMGIEKEEIPRIFERFYRVNKARDRNSGGTGLGLAIVKHLLEAHKGKVTVESELGKSTTFSVELLKKFPLD